MGPNLFCKTCKKQVYLLLDKATKKVHCDTCDAELQSNHFINQQLDALRRVRVPKKEFWNIKCGKCGCLKKPMLENEKVLCPQCKATYDHLTPVFLLVLKNQLKKSDD